MFKFRLAGILRLKEYKERQCRDEVGQCLHRLSLEEKKEEEIKSHIFDLESKIMNLQEGAIDVEELKSQYGYLQYTKNVLVLQKEIVAQKRIDLLGARNRLFEAMKEKKALEKLQAKKYEQYLYEQAQKEQALMDELANRG